MIDDEDYYPVLRERDRLRQELSLAEEGLANYARKNAQLRIYLQRYGRHKLGCPASGMFTPPEGAPYCTCGFEALTAEPQGAGK